MLKSLCNAAEQQELLPLLLLQAERVKELDLLCPGLRTADSTATRSAAAPAAVCCSLFVRDT
jgi:hypothetical protein